MTKSGGPTSVCFTVRRDDEAAHLAGINKLLVTDRGTLFSASRDGNVREFDFKKKQCLNIYARHEGWVNDITLVPSNSATSHVVSVSNDCSVRLNNELLYHHSDYVKTVTNISNQENSIATAGLDCVLNTCDLARQKQLTAFKLSNSIYSLGADSYMIAAGTSGSKIHLFDIRQSSLKPKISFSHGSAKTVISSVQFIDDKTILSADCDGTVKVWSLEAEKAISTIDCEAGVTCLEVVDNKVYAGLLNGNVLFTDLRDSFLFQVDELTELPQCTGPRIGQTQPTLQVSSLAFSSDYNNSLFIASGQSSHIYSDQVGLQVIDGEPHKADLFLSGQPVFRKVKICSDRQHYATLDSENSFKLWNILSQQCIHSSQLVNHTFEQAFREHDQNVYVPSWCTIDFRCGRPTVILEPSEYSNSWVYIDPESSRVRENLGQLMRDKIRTTSIEDLCVFYSNASGKTSLADPPMWWEDVAFSGKEPPKQSFYLREFNPDSENFERHEDDEGQGALQGQNTVQMRKLALHIYKNIDKQSGCRRDGNISEDEAFNLYAMSCNGRRLNAYEDLRTVSHRIWNKPDYPIIHFKRVPATSF